jgi:4-amino-4-deoxy-L-arabinose transferase-like glycosyltransferase
MFVVCGLSMYSIALRISGNRWKAALCTIVLAFGTMLWPYSAVFYGHVPAAAFLAMAFALLFGANATEDPDPSLRWFWIGTGVSMAFLSDHTSALVIVGLAAYALYALRMLDLKSKMRAASTALPGLLLPLLIFLAYNLAIYGKPVAFGYAYEVEERFQEIMGPA